MSRTVRLSRRVAPSHARIVRACVFGIAGGDVRRFNLIIDGLHTRGEYGSVRAVALRHGVSPTTLWRWLRRVDSVAPAALKHDETVADFGTSRVSP